MVIFFRLIGNPICMDPEATATYCDIPTESNSSYSTPPDNCIPATSCSLDQTTSPSCKCSYPYTGTLTFRAPSFSDLGNSNIYISLQNTMMESFKSNELPVDSVSLSQPTKNPDDYLLVILKVFPSGGERFNRSGISRIGFVLSNQTYKPPHAFGPYFFLGNNYDFFPGKTSYFLSIVFLITHIWLQDNLWTCLFLISCIFLFQITDEQKRKHKSVSIGLIIGVSAGGCVLVLLLLIAGVYAFRQKGRAERATKKNSPFGKTG